MPPEIHLDLTETPTIGSGETLIIESTIRYANTGEPLSWRLDGWTVIPAGLSAADAYHLGD